MKIIWVSLEAEVASPKIEAVLQNSDTSAEVVLTGIAPYAPQALQVQLLTGLRPERTGMFDELSLDGYKVVPTAISAAASEKMLWRLLQDLKHTISPETPELVYLAGDHLNELERLAEEDDFKVVTMPLLAGSVKPVDINNFLEQKGIIERDETGKINWAETLAYYIGYGQLRINLLGREPEGIVTPGAEYQEVCEILAKLLKQLVDPVSQKSVIENIWKKSDLYLEEGDYFVQAPDLALTFRPGYASSTQSRWLSFAEVKPESHLAYTGHHKMIISGPGIKPGCRTSGALVDVVPTLLGLLGLNAGFSLDGQIIKDIFEPELLNQILSAQPLGSQLTNSEEKLLIDRLEALGYLE